MDQAMIEFQSVTKQYQGGQPAVERLTMSINQGSITVFVGPSGCGKTTSLRMINRMVEPTSGVITVAGKDVTSVPAPELRRSMGYVMQSSGLLPHRSVLDNIATVPRLNGVPKAAARKRAAELLDVVGLDPSLGKRYPSQLSGGQQQRVGVARALAADPPVLLMDEPFSAVDPVVRENLQDELLKLQSELGKTIVFVTHDIDEAVKLGDRVAVFRVGGKLAQYDEPGVLLSRPADNFVDSDRGYRGLSFLSSKALPLGELRTARAGDRTEQGWTLVLDHEGRPLGWWHDRTGGATVDDALVPGGSLYDTASGSLRSALDAALSSPSGQGVAVDGDGVTVGSVAADDVLTALAAVRRAEAA